MNESSIRAKAIPSKKAMIWAFLVVALWWFVISTGTRMPYLHTQMAFRLRAFFLFPALLGLLSYLAFFFRGKFPLTGYRRRMSQLATKQPKSKKLLGAYLG